MNSTLKQCKRYKSALIMITLLMYPAQWGQSLTWVSKNELCKNTLPSIMGENMSKAHWFCFLNKYKILLQSITVTVTRQNQQNLNFVQTPVSTKCWQSVTEAVLNIINWIILHFILKHTGSIECTGIHYINHKKHI